jgi:hypothetical protein
VLRAGFAGGLVAQEMRANTTRSKYKRKKPSEIVQKHHSKMDVEHGAYEEGPTPALPAHYGMEPLA